MPGTLLPRGLFGRYPVVGNPGMFGLPGIRPCGVASSSARFRGVEFLRANPNPNLDVGTVMDATLNAAFTFDLWVRPDIIGPGFQKVFSIGRTDQLLDSQVTLDISPAGQFRWITVVPPSFLVATHPTVLVAGTWYHVWCQVWNTLTNQVTLAIRVDNAGESTNAATGNVQPQPGTNPLFVGMLPAGGFPGVNSYFLTGRVDSFGIWSRLLTVPERDFMHNGGAGQNYACLGAGIKVGLVSFYDLDEPSGSLSWRDLQDSNVLTATGIVLSAPGRNL